MDNLTFYKIISPYEGDVTKDCNLTVIDIDNNFLSLKDNTISGATFDQTANLLKLEKNNGEVMAVSISGVTGSVDIEEIKTFINNEIKRQMSGHTCCHEDVHGNMGDRGDMELELDTCCCCDGSVLEGEVSEDGTLSIIVAHKKEQHDLDKIIHGGSLSGDGQHDNQLRLANTEHTSHYKNVTDIVTYLPDTTFLPLGSRYITCEDLSSWGRLYNQNGMELISRYLKDRECPWRVPTKEDWDKLFKYAEACPQDYSSGADGIEQGDVAARHLRSKTSWSGTTTSFDTYGFQALPTGYLDETGNLINPYLQAKFWTSSNGAGTTKYLIKSMHGDKTTIGQSFADDDNMYAIRLVCDYDSVASGFKADILGQSYDIINIRDLNQLWITSNLNANVGADKCVCTAYSDTEHVKTQYIINHWNGWYWEKKVLEHGDTVTVGVDSHLKEYKVFFINGNANLVKTMEIELDINGFPILK